ncbi:MAG: caspase family protein, partial [Bacteroidota bacterium]
ASGDPTLDSGEYVDTYTVTGTGGPLVADLRSDSFDPYLIVLGPDGVDVQNDDYEGSLERSLVVVDTEEGASYRVLVTSYAAEETGRYRLDIRTDDAAIVAGIRTETGTLADGDETLDSGEFIDRYTFEAVPGQRLQADLTSDAFDTYLALQTPSGEVTEDDDGGGRPGHSVLNVDLTEPGRYTVFVTSYAAAETGDYELSLDLTGEYGVEPTPGGGLADDGVPESTGRLAFEETARASLSAGDRRLSSGEFMDVHTFDISDPGPVRVEMASSAFDTFLIIESPNGQRLQNDDFEGSTSQSVVEFSANQPGRYRVIATSYREGEVGPYTMRLTAADALAPEPPAYDRIAGLFVGISDYETIGDLRWTAEDAEIAHDAMIQAGMDPSDGILLTDADATAGAVRDAIADLASRTDDRTLMVLFFSGHGGQYERAEGFQRQDPDGIDESLEMYDAPILDDEMDALLATIPSARQLVVVDACFSGGFAKDLISRPGRMGLFSSEEDIVSAVAVKFEAGGYLSRFFAEAVTQQAADEDNNGAVTALELSHYLEQRFVADVQQAEEGALDMLASRDTRPEHQKLVVDRGSVGLYESLFLFRP